MRVFVDFEASSLNKDSYPIEVAWVFEDGRSETHLIRPAEDWTDWEPEAEAIHGIARETLLRDGEPVEAVARRMVDELLPHRMYASAPSWDGKWLSALLRAAGLPRHALRLSDTDQALVETAAEILRPALPAASLLPAIASVLVEVRCAFADEPVRHRALEDAQGEWRRWLEAVRLARELAARGAQGSEPQREGPPGR